MIHVIAATNDIPADIYNPILPCRQHQITWSNIQQIPPTMNVTHLQVRRMSSNSSSSRSGETLRLATSIVVVVAVARHYCWQYGWQQVQVERRTNKQQQLSKETCPIKIVDILMKPKGVQYVNVNVTSIIRR